ncbi:hypothetical protein M409DRAFT_16998 [Zasmidium cellare ATCC 36951]|uniref:Chromosome transmission fidelity protein 8 n=1 Tax=Zasmidium cellare ATCC 36951 TaxID=1080233 RepID=A0A6A6D3M1_ZASCE|nr:uncharacterized protein M409DRAFT_16998 [Zasmidium cellare ATCC 36951]KAF2173048.1 hypothetical protein M409DRAFT_16998 [Zasmidium cellare ATCC 36951]
MPTISLRLPAADRNGNTASNALPPLLQTPSGLAILELQGSVLAEHGDVEGSTAVLPLGKLVFPSADGQDGGDWDGKRVFLFVGKHQRMTGEVKKLAKPLAIVRRRRPDVSADDDDAPPAAGDEVEIAEIAHFKILFTHRPEPMGGDQEEFVLED